MSNINVKYLSNTSLKPFFVLPTPVFALRLIYKLLKPNTFILSKGVHCTRTSPYAPKKDDTFKILARWLLWLHILDPSHLVCVVCVYGCALPCLSWRLEVKWGLTRATKQPPNVIQMGFLLRNGSFQRNNELIWGHFLITSQLPNLVSEGCNRKLKLHWRTTTRASSSLLLLPHEPQRNVSQVGSGGGEGGGCRLLCCLQMWQRR